LPLSEARLGSDVSSLCRLGRLKSMPLQKQLSGSAPVLDLRRIKSDLVLVRGYSCMNFADFFVLRNTSITRGHNFKLYKPLCNLNVRKYSFAHRVVDIWNCLSSDIVSTDDICTFRTNFDSLHGPRSLH